MNQPIELLCMSPSSHLPFNLLPMFHIINCFRLVNYSNLIKFIGKNVKAFLKQNKHIKI